MICLLTAAETGQDRTGPRFLHEPHSLRMLILEGSLSLSPLFSSCLLSLPFPAPLLHLLVPGSPDPSP